MTRKGFLRLCLGLLLLTAISNAAIAAKRPETVNKTSTPAVELFAAKASGEIDVKLIPQDSTTGTVVIANRTDRPLTIRLPEAFAGVPVLAQAPNGGGNARSTRGSGNGGGGNQALGGGFGGGLSGGGAGLGGGGGGFFAVEPERVVKLKIETVCLEHGKRDPHPRVNYELVPIEQVTGDPKVIAVVQMLGRGEIDQASAQASAWHLANGLTWQNLVEKIGAKHLDGSTERYFSADTLVRASRVVTEVTHRTAGLKVTVKSLGESALIRD